MGLGTHGRGCEETRTWLQGTEVPSAGESVQEVQVASGARATAIRRTRRSVVEIETDKAAMELPSPVSGRSPSQAKGEIAQVGDVLAPVEESPRTPAGKPSPRAEQPPRSAGGRAGREQSRPAPAVVMRERVAPWPSPVCRPSRCNHGPGGRLSRRTSFGPIQDAAAARAFAPQTPRSPSRLPPPGRQKRSCPCPCSAGAWPALVRPSRTPPC